MITERRRIAAILKQSARKLIAATPDEQHNCVSARRTSEAELRTQTKEIISMLQQAQHTTQITNKQSAEKQAIHKIQHFANGI